MADVVVDGAAARVVRLPGLRNVRDLGGLPAADGARVRTGRVLRAELLGGPDAPEMCGTYDEADADRFRALGLRTILDLRTPDEEAEVPSQWVRATSARLVNVPVAEGGRLIEGMLSGVVPATTAEEFGRLYTKMFDRRAEAFGAALTVLAEPAVLPAVVHCSAGKDRTGALVALLLSVLGVPRDLVVEDYAYTGVARPDRVDLYADDLAAVGRSVEEVRVFFEAPPVTMRVALDHLDAEYGGVEAYLTGPGRTDPAVLERLRDTMLEKGPEPR